jgi:hypothetical protein
MLIAPLVLAVSAGPAGATTTYSPTDTPVVASITNGASAAPWNEYQGDSASTAYPYSDLFPTFLPGGPTTGTGSASSPTEPNVAVFPSATSGTDIGTGAGQTGEPPYPTGTIGTPGTLDDYCGSGTAAQEAAASSTTGTPVRQPAGTTLPLGPTYFPHLVRNSNGDLTGYFDYRPKDADEAIIAATSTDNGNDWTYNGEALEQDPGYCPSADTNDDGEGHANIITVGANTFLYTLPRAAGDMQGVGMIVHEFSPSESNPLNGLPAIEKTGIDPDGFATAPETINSAGGETLPLTTAGSAGSTEQLVTGGFVDLTQDQNPVPAQVITCTVTSGSSTLTACSSTTTINVAQGDLIEQVIGYVSAQAGDNGAIIPAGPNTTTGDGGLASFDVSPSSTAASATSGSSNLGFTLPLTGSTFNNNAPGRAYINGTAVYCTQSNNNPTTKMETCTTGPNNASLTLATGQIITGDPIIPQGAYNTDPTAGGMTSGLVAPDGIVGVLPGGYPNDGTVPTGATYVMYTEKELNYYLAGDTTVAETFTSSSPGNSLTYNAGPYITQDMPSQGTTWTFEMGATSNESNPPGGVEPTAIIPVTCTTTTSGDSGSVSGCTVPSAYTGWTAAAKSYMAAAGANTSSPTTSGATAVNPSTLALTGEGSASNIAKLYKNNEDLAVTQVAWTTNGYQFSNTGLANGGIISGENDCASSSPNAICTSSSSYDDLSNPSTNVSPGNLNGFAQNDAADGTGTGSGGTGPGTDLGGNPDTTEMRWLGSAGSIINNGDGTYGLFLSGAWAADGDSDAFNQVFYATTTDGEHWSVPVPVVSTDYSFSASVLQDQELGTGQDDPLGISAYYSGRAYAPSVVQNPTTGALTMLFSGDRLPKSIAPSGITTIGTNSSSQYTIGSTDPALYRNILAVTFTPETGPGDGTPEAPYAVLLPLFGLAAFAAAVVYGNRRRRKGLLA